MNDDDIRGALDAYATAAPDSDPRPGFGARLARRRRLRAVAGVTAAAAFIGGTGVAVLTGGDSPDRVVAADDPTPEPEASASASPSATAAATSAPTSPSPTATTPPAAASPSAATASPSPVPPPPPAEPVTVTAEGEHGLRVRVTLDPANPATATESTLTVEATDDDGSIHVSAISWGDGVDEATAVTAMCEPDPPLGRTYEPRPDRIRHQRGHAWRHAGEFRVKVVVRSEFQCQSTPPKEEVTVELTARVRPGRVTSNGPAGPSRPEFEPRHVPEEAPRYYDVSLYVTDADGHVADAVVDWGDGATTPVRNEYGCNDGGGRHYPVHGGMSVDAAHTYARAGTYTVTIRYASTGCGGGDAQPASVAATVRVS